jgi:hypothetical protein
MEAGLLQLLANRRIAIGEAAKDRQSPMLMLREPINEPGPDSVQHLAALELCLRDAAGGGSLVGSSLASALQDRFGPAYKRFVHDEVAPSLVHRGLLKREDGKLLRLFPRIRYARTPAGDALAAVIQPRLFAAARIPALLKTDPGAAVRTARAAGLLLILSPKARRAVPALRKACAEYDDVDAVLALLSEEDRDTGDLECLLDLEALALSMDFEALLGALEVVIDAAADAAAGSSDGGGDGGDGGGGGGD